MQQTWRFLSIVALAGVTLLFGCGDTITIHPSAQLAEGIQVTGMGSAFGEPDLIILSVGVSAEEKNGGDRPNTGC